MTAPVKVLVLTASLNVGGGEMFMLNLLSEFSRTLNDPDKKGTDAGESLSIHLCAFGSKSVFSQNSLLPKVQELQLPTNLIPSKRFYQLSTLLEIRRYIKQHDINVIQTFLSHADIVGNFLGKLLGIPVVTTLENIPFDYNQLRFDYSWLMKNVAIRFATQLVALSDEIRRETIKAWDVDPDRLMTIFNAVPVSNYAQIPIGTSSSRDDGKVIVTAVGRLTAQKAHNILLDATSLVVEKHENVIIQIVGQGELEDELKAQVKALNIGNNVRFLGMRRDIPEILAESDIFVLSSAWEGMPVAAIEAMAAARPQILTTVGASEELVEQGEQGLLVPPLDRGALADAITTLATDKALRETMGAKARTRAMDYFSITSSCEAYHGVYTKLAQHR